jgi:hypothetical protein
MSSNATMLPALMHRAGITAALVALPAGPTAAAPLVPVRAVSEGRWRSPRCEP